MCFLTEPDSQQLPVYLCHTGDAGKSFPGMGILPRMSVGGGLVRTSKNLAPGCGDFFVQTGQLLHILD